MLVNHSDFFSSLMSRHRHVTMSTFRKHGRYVRLAFAKILQCRLSRQGQLRLELHKRSKTSISRRNVSGAFLNPKGILVKRKGPWKDVSAVSLRWSWATSTCEYKPFASIVGNIVAVLNESINASCALSSTSPDHHCVQCWIIDSEAERAVFFRTTTTGDAHSGWTGSITSMETIQSISCFWILSPSNLLDMKRNV